MRGHGYGTATRAGFSDLDPGPLDIDMLAKLWTFTHELVQTEMLVYNRYSMDSGAACTTPSVASSSHTEHLTCTSGWSETSTNRAKWRGVPFRGLKGVKIGTSTKINQNPRSRTGRLVQSWGPGGHVDGSAIPVAFALDRDLRVSLIALLSSCGTPSILSSAWLIGTAQSAK
jgi:hypothetical protein